ncbi:MAG: hypothetical protein ACRDVP_02075 [Acidimicrobiales bacterium]
MIRPLHPLPKQGDDPVTPFIATPEGRPFRLLIDRATVIEGEALQVLDAFAALPDIECWSTTDGSERWIEIDWATEVTDHIAVRLHTPGHLAHAALNPASTWRSFAERTATAQLPIQEALRQLGYAELSARHRFDMMVSDSPALLGEPVGIGTRVNIRSSTEAVAHLPLFNASAAKTSSPEPTLI